MNLHKCTLIYPLLVTYTSSIILDFEVDKLTMHYCRTYERAKKLIRILISLQLSSKINFPGSFKSKMESVENKECIAPFDLYCNSRSGKKPMARIGFGVSQNKFLFRLNNSIGFAIDAQKLSGYLTNGKVYCLRDGKS